VRWILLSQLSAGGRKETNMVELARRKKRLSMRKNEKGGKKDFVYFSCVSLLRPLDCSYNIFVSDQQLIDEFYSRVTTFYISILTEALNAHILYGSHDFDHSSSLGIRRFGFVK
jgi:hypothetical protein